MKRLTTTIAALAALSLLAAACGDDDDGGRGHHRRRSGGHDDRGRRRDHDGRRDDRHRADDPVDRRHHRGQRHRRARRTSTPTATARSIIGVATPGPRNDGAYYQALVDGVTKFSTENGYEEPIIVDNIKPEEAATQLDGLARQNVDMIAVGAGEIADPLPDLTAKYGDIIWYCNCGGGFQELPNLIQSGDDGSEIGYSAGYATGLLMKAKGVTKAAMIGNNSFNFEKESFGAFRLGLDAGRPVLRVDVRRDRLVQRRRRGHRGVQQPQGAGRRGHLPVPRRLARGGRQAVERERRHHDERRRGQRLRAHRPRLPDRRQVRRRPVRGHDPRRDPVGRARSAARPACSTSASTTSVGAVICDPTPEQTDGDGGRATRRSPPATSTSRVRQEPARRRTPLERSARGHGGGGRPTAPPPTRGVAAVRLDGITKRYGRGRGVRRRRPDARSRAASTACSARTAPASRR